MEKSSYRLDFVPKLPKLQNDYVKIMEQIRVWNITAELKTIYDP